MRLSQIVVVVAALSFASLAGCKKADPVVDSKGKAELAGNYAIVKANDAATGAEYKGSAVIAKNALLRRIDGLGRLEEDATPRDDKGARF